MSQQITIIEDKLNDQYIVIDRYGRNDYSLLITDDPNSEDAGTSFRGTLRELREELPNIKISKNREVSDVLRHCALSDIVMDCDPIECVLGFFEDWNNLINAARICWRTGEARYDYPEMMLEMNFDSIALGDLHRSIRVLANFAMDHELDFMQEGVDHKALNELEGKVTAHEHIARGFAMLDWESPEECYHELARDFMDAFPGKPPMSLEEFTAQYPDELTQEQKNLAQRIHNLFHNL